MSASLTAPEILDREFLALRARLIDIAAILDRLDRAGGTLAGDPRLEQIRQSLAILAGQTSDRAERVQLAFSLPYRKSWRQDFELLNTDPIP